MKFIEGTDKTIQITTDKNNFIYTPKIVKVFLIKFPFKEKLTKITILKFVCYTFKNKIKTYLIQIIAMYNLSNKIFTFKINIRQGKVSQGIIYNIYIYQLDFSVSLK